MALDVYAEALADLDPGAGEVETAELVVTDDVLVKLFALGPDAELDPHEHPDSTNVFHVLAGEVTVVRDDEREAVAAPGVVRHDRGDVHGARNETDEVAAFTASLCPLPGSG
ncbi:cupin domain-containing protein [Halobaculum sp. CBA1158]|uniref:cupin domain-containing protein n=1 Tax=Halobaculum sp. CBA1158 TaxID=2904243 RepID=UPI001F44DC01|nr:cupin domain-containing protein [Halobaculum sp. CBA1158]UIO99447.1 cupin domain-containing protein [Halobaculum sp. CBA1158]